MKQTTTELPCPRLLDAKQAAALLGLGESTFHRHRALGLIGPQPIRLGGSIRWDGQQLSRWIDAGCPDAPTWQATQEAELERSVKPTVLRYAVKG